MKNISRSKLLILLLIAVVGLLALGCAKKEKVLSEQSFPTEYRGMSQVQMITGQQAIDGISKLHGTNIAIKEGYQAMYQSSDKQMILWISVSNNVDEATQLMNAMNTKIQGSKAFTGFKEETVSGQKLYYVFGMNMDNYYYQKNNTVYWVAIGANDTKTELKAVLKDF